MIASFNGPIPPPIEASRLESLFGDIARAVEEGRLEAALRLADCARRVAPSNSTCVLVHARLLIRLGAASEAAERLRGREEPDAIVARAEALCEQSLFEAAAASAEMLLQRFAVDAVENLRPLAARLSGAESSFPGWVGVDSRLHLVGEVRTGSHVTISCSGTIVYPTLEAIDQNGFDSFECKMPTGISGPLAVFTGDLQLLGSGLAWPPEFGLSGWVIVENRALVGKVRLDWAPALPIRLAIGQCGGQHIRLPVASAADSSTGSTFSIPLDTLALGSLPLGSFRIAVSAVLPDGWLSPLTGSPLEMQTLVPTPVGVRPKRTSRENVNPESRSKQIDIVVPVYAGFNETLFCMERVLATTARSDAKLVVINDASPDVELCAALEGLARDGRITLLVNQSNLGFPGSANRGMNLHPDRDIVLLNSDTVIFGDWLDRLKYAAYGMDDIGTATPLGEIASIMSYPGEAHGKTRVDAAEIDRIARLVNARMWMELPVGVGFCMYIRRACLSEAGGFREDMFGRGYGEENDFCLRARRLGWRHVGATDVFVGHRGGRSYGRAKDLLAERNRRVLNVLHPGYDALIAGFVAADPLRGARRAIDIQRLIQEATEPVLLVTLDLPGGVRRHVEQRESELRAEGRMVLTLRPSGKPGLIGQAILTTQDGGLGDLAFDLPQETPLLRDLLSRLRLSHIELHHFVGLPAPALELVVSLGIRYDVYVHDYSWICPRITLLGGNGVYCGEPPIEDCETCIRKHGTSLEESLTVAALRTRSARILDDANVVVAPSEDVRSRFARYFPNLPIKVTGWEAPIEPMHRSPPAAAKRIRVAVLGAISIQKGYRILLECARDASQRNLDLDFVVIGYTFDDERLLATGRVFIVGPYADNEVGALLEREKCHIALFPSVAPETWCYALSHAIRGGLPIVAFDMGAISERLRAYAAAELITLLTTPAGINDSLLRLMRKVTTAEAQKELNMNNTSPTNAPPVSEQLEASAKILTLPAGVYAFTVQDGASTFSTEELALPALQVGLAPMKSPGRVEFLGGVATLDRWLVHSSDVIVVRISGDSASLLLTSVRSPGSSVLAISVRRLATEPGALTLEQQDGQARAVIQTQIMAHIKNFGDVHFTDGWAGFIGEKLWIEAFAILSAGQLPPDSIEYRGVTADGYETPWLSNRVLCGSRGRGLPITGYAIRLRPDTARRYDCSYLGKFVSGSTQGPFRDGTLCRSDLPGDPLEGIELRVAERTAVGPSAQVENSQYSVAG